MLALGALAVGALALTAALVDVQSRQSALPAVVAIDKDVLEEALNDAPAISSDEDADENQDDDSTDGPVLWLVTAPDCPKCRAFEKGAMAKLIDSGVEVRAIVVAPRKLAANTQGARDVAALMKERDWTGVHLWMQGKRPPSSEAMDPDEEDGLLEWGRQSAERIGAVLKRNDLIMDEPALFWRNGPEWRASVGGNESAYHQIEQELAPKA